MLSPQDARGSLRMLFDEVVRQMSTTGVGIWFRLAVVLSAARTHLRPSLDREPTSRPGINEPLICSRVA